MIDEGLQVRLDVGARNAGSRALKEGADAALRAVLANGVITSVGFVISVVGLRGQRQKAVPIDAGDVLPVLEDAGVANVGLDDDLELVDDASAWIAGEEYGALATAATVDA